MNKVSSEHQGEIVTNTLTNSEEKIIKSQKDEIMKLKAALNYKKREYRNNMFDIGQQIGSDEDLEKQISRSNSKFWNEFREKRNVLQKIPAQDKANIEQEIKISRMKKKMEDSQKEFNYKQEKFVAETYQLQDELRYYKDQLEISENTSKDQKRQQVQRKLHDFNKLAENNRFLINEKSKATCKFPESITQFDVDSYAPSEKIKEQAFNNQNSKNDNHVTNMIDNHVKIIENKKFEYETLQKKRNEEIEYFEKKCKEKARKKKKEIKEIDKEMQELFEMSKLQTKLIENISVNFCFFYKKIERCIWFRD